METSAIIALIRYVEDSKRKLTGIAYYEPEAHTPSQLCANARHRKPCLIKYTHVCGKAEEGSITDLPQNPRSDSDRWIFETIDQAFRSTRHTRARIACRWTSLALIYKSAYSRSNRASHIDSVRMSTSHHLELSFPALDHAVPPYVYGIHSGSGFPVGAQH